MTAYTKKVIDAFRGEIILNSDLEDISEKDQDRIEKFFSSKLEEVQEEAYIRAQKDLSRDYKKDIEEAQKRGREEIKQAFIKTYKGRGDHFFSYVSEGNCTPEEEQQAIEEEWEQVMSELSKEGSKTE